MFIYNCIPETKSITLEMQILLCNINTENISQALLCIRTMSPKVKSKFTAWWYLNFFWNQSAQLLDELSGFGWNRVIILNFWIITPKLTNLEYKISHLWHISKEQLIVWLLWKQKLVSLQWIEILWFLRLNECNVNFIPIWAVVNPAKASQQSGTLPRHTLIWTRSFNDTILFYLWNNIGMFASWIYASCTIHDEFVITTT